jgi:hypothetical protein
MGEVALRKFYLYSTIQRIYLVARSKDRQAWRLVKFNRDPVVPTELEAVEDPVTYSEKEMAMLLSQISAGNASHGGIKFEVTVCISSVHCLYFEKSESCTSVAGSLFE